ncbi:MAG: SLAP domain-containing protein [Oscillospiraceae bacterium]|nr:SLAP domain-containing protein [Oscillospiraceae bacterium]
MAKKNSVQEIDIVSRELEALKKQSADYAINGDKNNKKAKIIITFCVAVAVVLIAAVITAVVMVESQSPISYGPHALESEMTDEMTAEHERRIKIIDENGGIREGVNFVGYHARFDENGDLVVDGYMRNFTGHEIYDITGNITVSNANDDHVGSAYFEFMQEDFGTLKNEKSRPWRIIIDNDYVNVEVTDLSSFKVKTEFTFYQK